MLAHKVELQIQAAVLVVQHIQEQVVLVALV